ncbi:MAG: lactate utilization protein [Candidatus Solibacter usitatus]|nr:lactate utilization protein [Candidatus Solibacter usitatus]
MTAREEILQNVQTALGRTAGQPPAAAPPARIRIPEIAVASRVSLFTERLEAVGGKVHLAASRDEARDIVAGLIGTEGAVASNAPLLEQAGITRLQGVSSGHGDEGSLRAACATAPFGITTADFGLAETGSLVTRSSTEARLLSLLPPVHIALLPLGLLITGLDELFSKVPLPAGDTSSLVIITGPSRSADIEMILVRGVHGPRVVHVIVLEQE